MQATWVSASLSIRGDLLVKMSIRAEELSCGHCSFITFQVDDLEKHLKMKHGALDQERFMCNQCDFSTNTERNLKRHNANMHNPVKGKKPEDAIKCNQCDFTCASPKGIATHRYRAHLLQAFQTGNKVQEDEEEAAEPRPSPKSVQKVQESPRPDSNASGSNKPPRKSAAAASGPSDILKVCIRCSVCEFMCNSLRSMAEHIDVVHSAGADPDSPRPDDQDDENDEVVEDGAEIMETEEVPESCSVFKCPSCDVSYDKNWKLTRHFKVYPSHLNSRGEVEEGHAEIAEDYQYTEAGNQNQDNSSFSGNESIEKSGPSCNVCGKIFSTKANLKRHFSLKHQVEEEVDSLVENKVHEVQNGSKPTTEVTSPPAETLIKSGSKFECDICGGMFSRRFSLKQHQMRFHSSPQRQDVEDLQQGDEEEEETSEINPCCPVCEKDFISESDLQRHIQRRHSGDPRITDGEKSDNTVYSCKVCSEKVIGISNLEKHNQNFHSNSKRQIVFSDAGDDVGEDVEAKRPRGVTDITKKIIDCSLCDAKLGSKSSLQRHKKRVHG